MHKVGIIGLGHVGTTVAHILLMKDLVDELVLIDQDEKKVEAEYLDFSDSFARTSSSAMIKRNNYAELADADLIVTAFGDVSATARTGDRFAELPINLKNAAHVGKQIKESGFNGILVNISNPCDVIVNALQQATGLPHQRIFGTGTFLDTARMQRAVGAHFGEAPQNVSGLVLGEHGNSQFTAWSTVKLDGQAVTELADQGQIDLAQLDQEVKNAAFKVVAGKGYTSYAVATCAVRMVMAVFQDKHEFMPASVYLKQYGCYIGYPAIIGQQGVEKVKPVSLTAEEIAKLKNSVKTITAKAQD